jgi:CheY-like chemotaxis protein
VLLCTDGADACAQFARHLAEIEIVLTDIDMPVMGGVALIHVLKKMKPGIKIIISSGKATGLADQPNRTALDDIQVHSILTKPYAAEKILQVIHELLAEKTS